MGLNNFERSIPVSKAFEFPIDVLEILFHFGNTNTFGTEPKLFFFTTEFHLVNQVRNIGWEFRTSIEKELSFINYDNPLWAKVKVGIGECEYIGRRRTGTLLKTRVAVKHGQGGQKCKQCNSYAQNAAVGA